MFITAVLCDSEKLLNKLDEFEEAVKKTISDVRLDNDIVVSVFETNIRVLGYGHEVSLFRCYYLTTF